MASDIQIAREETHCRHYICYSFRLAARILLYASSHRHDNATTAVVTPVMEHWLEREIAQWVHHEGSIRPPTASCGYVGLSSLIRCNQNDCSYYSQSFLSFYLYEKSIVLPTNNIYFNFYCTSSFQTDLPWLFHCRNFRSKLSLFVCYFYLFMLGLLCYVILCCFILFIYLFVYL